MNNDTVHLRRIGARGNVTTMDRARVKRELREGELHIANLIARPRDSAARVDVLRVLGWAPYFGEARAQQLLVSANVRPTRLLGDLTPHERLRLQLTLRQDYPGIWARWEQLAEGPDQGDG